eukprot:TRINITY_DN338_c0_g1_i3.p1 TRINITY_DN338_c0_g1~~TRINITY_DN338_c0_g1_i3.p1  ORF type:complete len:724 (+),score=268.99 TRINITY_DN338_c0_g1_i3:77-2248(+)
MMSSRQLFFALSLVLALAGAVCSASPETTARDLAALDRDTAEIDAAVGSLAGDGSSRGGSSVSADDAAAGSAGAESDESETPLGAAGRAALAVMQTSRVESTLYTLMDLGVDVPIPAVPGLTVGFGVAREETASFKGASTESSTVSEIDGSVRISVGFKLGKVASLAVNFVGYAHLGLETKKADLKDVDWDDEDALLDQSFVTQFIRPYRSVGAMVILRSVSLIRDLIAKRIDTMVKVFDNIIASRVGARRIRAFADGKWASHEAVILSACRAAERRAGDASTEEATAIRRNLARGIMRRLKVSGDKGVWRADGRAGINALLSPLCARKLRTHIRSLWRAAKEAVRERNFSFEEVVDDYGRECAELLAPDVTGIYDALVESMARAAQATSPPTIAQIRVRVLGIRRALVDFSEDLGENSPVIRNLRKLKASINSDVDKLAVWCNAQMRAGPKVDFTFSFDVGLGGALQSVATKAEFGVALNGGVTGTIDPQSTTALVDTSAFGGFVINGLIEKRGLELSGFVRGMRVSSEPYNLRTYGVARPTVIHIKFRTLFPTDLGLFRAFIAESVLRNPHILQFAGSMIDLARAGFAQATGQEPNEEQAKQLLPALTRAFYHAMESFWRMGPLLIAPRLLKHRFGIVVTAQLAIHEGGIKFLDDQSSLQFVMVGDLGGALGPADDVAARVMGLNVKALVGKGLNLPLNNFLPQKSGTKANNGAEAEAKAK